MVTIPAPTTIGAIGTEGRVAKATSSASVTTDTTTVQGLNASSWDRTEPTSCHTFTGWSVARPTMESSW